MNSAHPVSLPVHAVLSPPPSVYPPDTCDSLRVVSRRSTSFLRSALVDVVFDFFMCPRFVFKRLSSVCRAPPRHAYIALVDV